VNRGRRPNQRYNNNNNGNSRGPPTPKILDEFDFETSNARFDKEKFLEELKRNKEDEKDIESSKDSNASSGNKEPGESGESGLTFDDSKSDDGSKAKITTKSYNKSESFFDKISCDALDRLNEQQEGDGGRSRRYQEQRRLDGETFGKLSLNDNRGGTRLYHNTRPQNSGQPTVGQTSSNRRIHHSNAPPSYSSGANFNSNFNSAHHNYHSNTSNHPSGNSTHYHRPPTDHRPPHQAKAFRFT